jgi:murein DD-endopeptidase MepM/ murein hydrolase activator NlpD
LTLMHASVMMYVMAETYRPSPIGHRGALVALVITLGLACGGSGPPPARSPAPLPVRAAPPRSDVADSTYLRSRALMVPVVGVIPAKVYDSYKAHRSGGRTHHALDIMAPRGTEVLAADDGRVLRMRRSQLGGLTIYALDAGERFIYYYAHLDRYAKTVYEGKIVAKGEVIGYVGTTGDAPKNTPHLHFQVMKRPSAARWWDGPPLDPLPYLALPGVKAAAAP